VHWRPCYEESIVPTRLGIIGFPPGSLGYALADGVDSRLKDATEENIDDKIKLFSTWENADDSLGSYVWTRIAISGTLI